MKQVHIKTLNRKEILGLYKGLKSSKAFTHRRCQILIGSAEGKSVKDISRSLYCSDQCVRDAILNFNKHGLKSIYEKDNARNKTSGIFDDNTIGNLQKIILHPPSYYGLKDKKWTLGTLVNVCYNEKIIERKISSRMLGYVLKKIGLDWKKFKKAGIKKR